jgi:hypothetical protein
MRESIDLLGQNNFRNDSQTTYDNYLTHGRVDPSKSSFCSQLSESIKNSVQESRLVLRIFLYISVFTIFILTCYMIVQSFNFGLIKSREDMRAGPRSTIIRLNPICFLTTLSAPIQQNVLNSDPKRAPTLNAILRKKCNL